MDAPGVRPSDFDVLLTDLDEETLKDEIPRYIGIPFLKEATEEEAAKVATELHGRIYSGTFRQVLPCVLSHKNKARWVFFLIDTGAPFTYISPQVSLIHIGRTNRVTLL